MSRREGERDLDTVPVGAGTRFGSGSEELEEESLPSSLEGVYTASNWA